MIPHGFLTRTPLSVSRSNFERAAVEVYDSRELLPPLLGGRILVGASSAAAPRPIERDGELGAELRAQPGHGLQGQSDHELGLGPSLLELRDLTR
eukprot:5059938-Pyramimonas_sp.AAC.1